ncbi:MAG: bifunctional 4-hydroxy-2-oxoglutarate aldolase/2-dehydro-3-deoxy-phosphogluconate aldolase [Verrucomicrobiales bacterium]|jgi:2-dehydro-3-deoxyphosphogluconate aldolase/(4S)-4-hydroxy-2-oxoglutarate aldolase|nr:bifunctional 4-hydroxy-2-oxoglutarate aldolase/2-dehydro-3-deoxy-phosphogluconate aldolase [Verrucomicrobiales bacterium]
MTKQESIHRLLNPGVVAVIRANSSEQLLDLAKALAAGGITGLEITMTTPNALQVITEVGKALGDQVYLGVGSVLDAATARAAILAGAEFVVSPVCKEEIIRAAHRYGKPVVSGAYTPTEALTAWENGADFVKIFPADGLGVNYLKAIKAPMPQLQIIPTGGVDVNNCGEFIKAGCAAVGVGGSLLKKDLLARSDWAGLSALAAQFVANVAKARAELRK